jgi:DNA-binding response OmpR family regulator
MTRNKRQCIMVVDNNQDMLELLNDTLETEGFDTVIVADEGSALNLLDKIEPDLVILDSATQNTGGLQTLDLMRKRSSVPIIMVSSEHEIGSLKQAFDHGADDYVSTPFGPRTFAARIRAKLRRTPKKV